MWNTPEGERKLEGKERRLFALSALSLYGQLRDVDDPDDECPTGVPLFDQIPIEERPFTLLHVANVILGDEPAPAPTAWNEAVILAIFNHLREEVEFEIDEDRPGGPQDPTYWRRDLHNTWMEQCIPGCGVEFEKDEGNRQAPDSKNFDGWDFKAESLTDLLLFDRDCEMEEFLDAGSGGLEEGGGEVGISKNYYADAPPLFSDAEKSVLLAFQQGLVGELGP